MNIVPSSLEFMTVAVSAPNCSSIYFSNIGFVILLPKQDREDVSYIENILCGISIRIIMNVIPSKCYVAIAQRLIMCL